MNLEISIISKNMTEGVNSFYSVTKINWFLWRALGVFPTKKYSNLYKLYTISIIIVISICYPLTLGIELFRQKSIKDVIENMATNATVCVCSIKLGIRFWKTKEIFEIAELLKPLDKRIQDSTEIHEIEIIKRNVKNMKIVYAISYMSVMVLGGLALIFLTEKRLMYPAYFPFDWKRFYVPVILYQYLGISYQVWINFANDSFSPTMLCLLSGHMKILCLRIERIGYNSDLKSSHYKELRQCIADHKQIIRFTKKFF